MDKAPNRNEAIKALEVGPFGPLVLASVSGQDLASAVEGQDKWLWRRENGAFWPRNLWKSAIEKLNKSSAYTQHVPFVNESRGLTCPGRAADLWPGAEEGGGPWKRCWGLKT